MDMAGEERERLSVTPYRLEGKRVFIAGHSGMVGSALLRRLAREMIVPVTISHAELDLRDQAAVRCWFAANRPQAVFMAAGKVGGIAANDARRAEFIFDNLMMTANVVDAAYRAGVEKLMIFGSACLYPKNSPQPIGEEMLLTGGLEPTNEPYAVAKIAGVKLAESYRRQYEADFISVMPTNLYGPGDNYHPEDSHVIAALIRRFHAARMIGAPEVTVWGTGMPRREFMHVDDLADAAVHVMRHHSSEAIVNIGTGVDHSIGALARMIAAMVGYAGAIRFDGARPDGVARRLLSVERLGRLGWRASITLEDGLPTAYRDFLTRFDPVAPRQAGPS